ncbi:acetyl-CoA carboxylase biotin carboxylase subunit family protein [Mesorhizobium sp. M0152]|uniref:ATP-grasp domain-containing protein n=1 Tax=Mesorhizobium sp. M0152 TaxID=2956898 RepID=UPI003336FCC9
MARALILIGGTVMGSGLLYVQAAQRLGLQPITLSDDPTRYDHFAAKGAETIRVDTDDLDALIRECCRLRGTYDIAGITAAADSFYATVGKLCRHFDLPGPNPEAIEQCCDKYTQRQLLAASGVPIPAYRLASNAADVEDSAAEIGLPVIVKPVVGSGSSGVQLCHSFGELAEHTAYLLSGNHIWRASPRILVEEYAQGPHYTIDIMGDDVIGIGALDFCRPPHFVYRELTYPAVLTGYKRKRIADVSLNCLRALGLGWGPTNIELRWTKRGPVVIEVNPRMPGSPCPQMVQLVYGVDLVTEHIKLVIGDEWNLLRSNPQTAVLRLLVPNRDGTIDWTDLGAADVPGVAEIKFYIKSGTPIIRKGDYRDCIGYVLATSPNIDLTRQILQRAVDLIHLSIMPLNTDN